MHEDVAKADHVAQGLGEIGGYPSGQLELREELPARPWFAQSIVGDDV
jgi:hypothetical protein